MPKINKEEYEALKALDSRAKSIVRQARGWLWVAEQPIMKDETGWYVEDGFDAVLEDDNLFHFIQWEDREPYNIAELIKEYEYSNEPEVLSQEWIDENKEARINNLRKRTKDDVVPVEKLRDLLVPKQEVTYEDALKVIAENIDTDEFSVGLYIEALNNNEKYAFLTDKWIDEHAKAVAYDGIPDQTEIVYVDELENLRRYKWSKVEGNMDKFMSALINSYEVEEPIVYALIKGWEKVKYDCKYWNYDTLYDEQLFPGSHADSNGRYKTQMTETEWNKLGIDKTNAYFSEELK